MDFRYRPVLPPTQLCQCDWPSSTSSIDPSHSKRTSPFFRALLAPYTPLWVDQEPEVAPDNADEDLPKQPSINFRVAFERRKKAASRLADTTILMSSLYEPKGKWAWMHQTPIHDRPEEIVIDNSKSQYSLCIKAARAYEERITYIRKLWFRHVRWRGFFSEAALFKVPLRPLQGVVVPALIGIHSNINGTQLTFDVPHHSFWIQASPDMPDVLKRRCLEAYEQLHGQGILHGSVDRTNILIGGDGQIKIINFDRSRSIRGYPELHLGVATPEDLKLEMREVHYKLDYRGARQKEHLNYSNRVTRPCTQLAFSSRREKIVPEKPPFSILLDPPIDPGPSGLNWSTPEDGYPKRFIVPGQSVQQYERHLRRFLFELDESGYDDYEEPKTPQPRLPSPTVPLAALSKRAASDQENKLHAGRNIQRYNLRKRKMTEVADPDPDAPTNKRVRFLATTRHSDGTKSLVRSPPPVGVKRHVPRVSREHPLTLDTPGDAALILEGSSDFTPPAAARIIPQSFSYSRDHHTAASPSASSPFLEYSSDLDYQKIFSVWRSTNANYLDDNDRHERVLGKRRRVDDVATFPINSEDSPPSRVLKRLRRTETLFFEPSGSSSSGPLSRKQPLAISHASGTSGQTLSPSPHLETRGLDPNTEGSEFGNGTGGTHSVFRLSAKVSAPVQTTLAGRNRPAETAGPSNGFTLSLEKARLVAGQLPSSVRTAANLIGGVLGLW